jgi:hypothetical protein
MLALVLPLGCSENNFGYDYREVIYKSQGDSVPGPFILEPLRRNITAFVAGTPTTVSRALAFRFGGTAPHPYIPIPSFALPLTALPAPLPASPG